MKRSVFIIFTFWVFSFLYSGNLDAEMADYCQVPPYVVQNVPPNVMVILDNSGSMFNLSYFDGFHTTSTGDDNLCTNNGSPCTGFTNPGTYPNFKYFGYFNPDYWYTYSSNRFVPSAPKTGSGISGARAKLSTEWDGNFLNWLTMRRLDVVRKVLTGGKTTSGEGSGYDRLIGEKADCDGRGKYKIITNAPDYTPYSGNRKFYVYSADAGCGGGGSGTSSFGVRNASDGSDGTGNESTFNVAVRVPSPVEGVLQSIVGTRARLGLSFYNVNAPTPHGGFVRVSVSGGSLSSTVNEINLTRPNSNTPLAETLWMVTGYFAQQATIAGGPGPLYNSGDFQINTKNDPYNYGTATAARWPICATSYVLYITDGEPCADGNLPATLTNYASGKSNYNCSGTSCPAVGSFPAQTLPSCGQGDYVAGIEDVALYANTTDLRNKPTLGVNNISGTQKLTTYVVFAFGRGSTLLQYAAINGGFEDINGNNIPDLQSEWDNNGDGVPDNFYEADEGYVLEQSIRDIFLSILRRASSGTAASVLASGEGRGANLVQAIFYPRRRFGNDIIAWTGENQNLWYYTDPFFTNSNIREDTQEDYQLHLKNDYIAQLYFDPSTQLTRARRYIDTDGDGDIDIETTTVNFEDMANLWKAGESLWRRNIASDPRTIYTTINGSSFLSGGFATSNKSTLRPYLNVSTDTEAEYLIRYIHGEGLTTEDLDGDGTTDIFGIDLNGDGVDDFRKRTVRIGSETYVWKLGDIVDSTPRIASWVPLNSYYNVYTDDTYKEFTETTNYKERGMTFTGANDGMLHAFKLGKLEIITEQYVKASLAGSELGKEVWAFVPKNALPYLKYFSDPEYCHLYTVDLPTYIFDASIGGNSTDTKTVNSWRTILIGGMRFGGACRNYNASCTDCVKTPIDGVGFSSYFALDITDQNNPQLLWEFSHPQLGFTTTGPAIIRIGDRAENGSWLAVFGSGPTGPLDTTNYQFLGRSDQNLRFFVLDLRTGTLLRTIDTGIQFAFASSMYNSTDDPDLDYQDDAIYHGYIKKANDGTWTDGGVGRLLTKEDSNPSNWVWSTVIDGIGPVTSSVARLQNRRTNTLWLYFGSGRYYFVQSSTVDDPDNMRTLFGIKEPCFSSSGLDQNCTSVVAPNTLTDVTDIDDVPGTAATNSSNFKGWYINLDTSGNYTYLEGSTSVTKGFKAERVITDPLATTSGLVFFTTFKPYSDECDIGGKTFIWAVRYNTGGAGGALLKGIALIQVSTAAIEQVDLSSAFTDMGARRTAAMEGVPPTAQGLSLLSMPPPVKRVVHIKER